MLKTFAKDARHFTHRCAKPDAHEMFEISRRVTLGCFALGFIGFFVKLVFIPINSIILGSNAV